MSAETGGGRDRDGDVDLVGLASRVAAQAGPGEQVEAYVSRGSQTGVRVHGGEVEAFTSATSQAIGIGLPPGFV